jgi:dTDP-4-dehydrorhamnose reductase
VSAAPIEVWASPEPTVARIDATRVRDQLAETGHEARDGDVELLASLGIRATRYPVLWEKVAPTAPYALDLRWPQERIARLVAHGIEPIVTLLHHGSGPAYTDLLDPRFPQLFAQYARGVARHFPDVRRWTPINEPLTTARFSTLYACWYPNRFFDHASFGRAIVHEALAIQLAMREIRDVIPDAQLVLTEDLQGFTAADRGVAEYVAHKSERRFLSAELVMGRVTPGHALWDYLVSTCEIPERDLMGWNYYPNSERVVFSDGPGRHRNLGLVDVAPEQLDCASRLREAAARLAVPVALSEVHCIGNEGERARWMLQRFDDACMLREEGVDVRAFGAWAAFGMIDWCSLLCRDERVCEDGVFTCAAPGEAPKPTLVAEVVRELAAGRIPCLCLAPGWWERPREAVA